VDSAAGAAAADDLFVREEVELVICYVATYATSSQVLRRSKGPVPGADPQSAAGQRAGLPRTDTANGWLTVAPAACPRLPALCPQPH